MTSYQAQLDALFREPFLPCPLALKPEVDPLTDRLTHPLRANDLSQFVEKPAGQAKRVGRVVVGSELWHTILIYDARNLFKSCIKSLNFDF